MTDQGVTDIVPRESDKPVMTPDGQIIDLSDPAQVAMAYDDLQYLKRMIREAEGRLKDALISHSAAVGKKTFEISGVGKVEIKGGSETKFDALGLKQGLKEAGCPDERISEIIQEATSYKVLAVEARRAAQANPEYAAVIKANSTVEDKTPSVTVNRIGGGRARVPAQSAVGELTAQDSSPADDSPGEQLPWE